MGVLEELKPLLKRHYEKATKHKKILIFISFALVVALVIIIFKYCFNFVYTDSVNQVSQYGIANVTEKANLINQYRTTSIQFIATIAQILGGIAIFIGIYYTWRRVTIAENSLKHAQETLVANQKIAQENLKIAQEGQITERFTRAVDQLGSRKLEIRLGGIYALERISHESEKDYWSILEILTAYVRINSPIKSEVTEVEVTNSQNKASVHTKLNTDIEATIEVLRRRLLYFGKGETESIKLDNTYLYEANFTKANLQGANLSEADLSGADLSLANLSGANLEGADLIAANLEEADLSGADLSLANFFRADLSEADLSGADLSLANFSEADLSLANLSGTDLTAAILSKANLSEADLSGADLTAAILSKANLSEANLSEANLPWADLIGVDLIGANLEGTDLIGANLEGANLEGADLSGANFYWANLSEAKNLTIDQLSKVKTLYNAKLDKELLNTLKDTHPDLFESPVTLGLTHIRYKTKYNKHFDLYLYLRKLTLFQNLVIFAFLD